MQTHLYASGFLYNVKTNQILLLNIQKIEGSDFLWSTLAGESMGEKEPEKVFSRTVERFLGIKLKPKDIYPVYDYLDDKKNAVNYVFYGQVKSSKKFVPFNGYSFSWVSFDQISKLPFKAGGKQDIIVGERVIRAKWREEEAKNAVIAPQADR